MASNILLTIKQVVFVWFFCFFFMLLFVSPVYATHQTPTTMLGIAPNTNAGTVIPFCNGGHNGTYPYDQGNPEPQDNAYWTFYRTNFPSTYSADPDINTSLCADVLFNVQHVRGSADSYSSPPSLTPKVMFRGCGGCSHTYEIRAYKVTRWTDTTGGVEIDISNGELKGNGQAYSIFDLWCNVGNHAGSCGSQTQVYTSGAQGFTDTGFPQVISGTIPSANFSQGGYYQIDIIITRNSDSVQTTASTFIRVDPLAAPINPLALDLTIRADSSANPPAVSTPGYISGLRSDDPNIPGKGSNFNNSLLLIPDLNPSYGYTVNDVNLIGVAFVSQTSFGPGATVLDTLKIRADADNGFVIVYAHCGGAASCTNGATTFTGDRVYIYFQGSWRPSGGLTSSFLVHAIPDFELRRDPLVNNPLAPRFFIKLFQPIGNHSWDTLSYFMHVNGSDESRPILVPKP